MPAASGRAGAEGSCDPEKVGVGGYLTQDPFSKTCTVATTGSCGFRRSNEVRQMKADLARIRARQTARQAGVNGRRHDLINLGHTMAVQDIEVVGRLC